MIAFMGNDGSGKTTIKNALADHYLKSSEDVISLTEFDYPILRLMRKVGSKDTKKVQRSIQRDSPSTLTKFLPYLMLFESSLQSAKYRFFARRKMVLKDRCLYDYLATWRELGVASELVEFLYKHAIKPDLIFYVSVMPDLAEKRCSQETSKESDKPLSFYELKKQIYDDIASQNNVAIVDNNGELDEALEKIKFYVFLRNTFKDLKQIALSGLDGAGKTTTMDNLSNLLSQINVQHKVIHFYYNYFPLRIAKALKGRQQHSTDKEQHEKSVAAEKKSVEKGKGGLWMRLVLLDAMIQYWFYRILFMRHVLLFDRFFPDYFVSFDFLNVPHNRERLNRLFPKPGVYFLQIADYKVLYDRKPEHTLEFFEKCYEEYMSLATEHNMILLDSTTKNPDIILKELLNGLISKKVSNELSGN